MGISGLVVTLSACEAEAEAALGEFRADASLEIGDRFEDRVVLLMETPSPAEDRAMWARLQETRGVVRVDVIFVGLDTADLRTGEAT